MIKLDEHYTIEGDSYNWMLKYEKKSFNGEKEIVSKDHWYYPNLRHCLKKYLDRSLVECKSIEEVIEAIDTVNNKIDNHGYTIQQQLKQ